VAESATGGRRVGGWVFFALVVALLGVVASVYSINHHIEVHATGQTDAACNINSTFSCDEVALSKYSEIAGIPLGVYGLGYFAAMMVLLGLGVWGGKAAKEHLQAYAVMVGIGLLVSLVLAGISIALLGNYCLTCIGVYTLTILQAVALVMGREDIPRGFDAKSVFSGGTTAAIAVAAVIFGYSFLKPGKGKVDEAANSSKPLPVVSDKAEDIPLSKSAYSGLGEDYRKGGDDATVVIQEFADFQCPACARIQGTLEELYREYGDKILIVYRNYPLDNSCNSAIRGKMHEYACKASVMARCAGQYGKFWEYHRIAFDRQSEMNNQTLKAWGAQVGLTDDQMEACLTSKDLLDKVKDDIALGNKLNVDSTPTLFINGRKVLGGRGVQELRAQIDQLLN
jgi:protein-disulfide isomerase/uncharacterized membrane protein